TGRTALLAEALRRLGILRHQRNDPAAARRLCSRSYAVARDIGEDLLAAEALNALGGIALETDAVAEARRHFLRALELGGRRRTLGARVEQNLGILANIQGDFDEARSRYQRSLDLYRAADDEHGCAIAYHNLGMVSTDRREFAAAERFFRRSREIAERTGDAYLRGLCLTNHAKVYLARGRYADARRVTEAALVLFDQLGVGSAKADAYRVLGMIERETGRPALAEARLRSAIELAVRAGSVLNEAEASRELAILCQASGRNQQALTLLGAAHRLFGRLEARAALVHVEGKIAELEAAYLAVVRAWGQSIETADTYTFGHCERVARHGVALARALGLDEHAQTTIRLGAYLHDLGKVRVPHEILSKPGPLTRDETAVVQMHPIWGIELLAEVAFPWDLKPIIRWHHERYDGTGYPDGLSGDAIPLFAQIVGLVDVYDALTTARPYRPAFTRGEALAQMAGARSWWSEAVFNAFQPEVLGP
ncbi:MAG TPA: HD domain-containing phosphohydrolase, partial [Gemmatimonadales bacterium]|nr:HD domain-containing phosphohydrolase [Gemmatimonadales bacterium]